MRKNLLQCYCLTFLFFAFSPAWAQKEINNWCFPTNSGFDFNSGIPVTTTSVMGAGQQEGCSSISDTAGNLLFYTDGAVVRDRNHAVMPNGTGLLGSYTTTEGALIAKQPGSPNIYFVFTIDMQNGPNGLHYSVVDMNLNGGMGDVQQLNLPLSAGTIFSEKMIGIRHNNNTDIWIITHESYTNAFFCYLVDASGVNPVPVITNIGQTYGSNDAVGSMHCTFDGTRIAAAYWNGLAGYEVFDFDKATGILSNPLFMTDPAYVWAYSVCFSPSGRFLYGGCYNSNQIFQFDLQLPAPVGVFIASTIGSVGDMQLGPDSNIYIALNGFGFVGAIYDPDSLGSACNFVESAVSLNGNTCSIGMTNYIYSIMNQPPLALFTAPHHVCPGTCTNFTNLSQYATSYQWFFPGGSPSSSTDVHPANVCYLTPGNYGVTLVATNAFGSDTTFLPNYITVYPYSPSQSILQSGDTLFSNTGFVAYQWFFAGDTIPGATDYFYVAIQSGDYSVVCIDDNGCSVEAVVLNVVAGTGSAVDYEPQIILYPNPVDQFVIISSDPVNYRDVINPEEIKIYNIIGEEMTAVQLPTANYHLRTLDVSHYPTGLYWIELVNGSKTFRAKFIKQ